MDRGDEGDMNTPIPCILFIHVKTLYSRAGVNMDGGDGGDLNSPSLASPVSMFKVLFLAAPQGRDIGIATSLIRRIWPSAWWVSPYTM